MPFLAAILTIGVSMCSHLLRGEKVALSKNIAISDVSVLLILGMAACRFGFSDDFWSDIFVCIVYSVVGAVELLGLLSALYDLASPLSKDEAGIEDKGEWQEMMPRG